MAWLKHTSWRAWRIGGPIILGCSAIWAATPGCASQASSAYPLGMSGTHSPEAPEASGNNRAVLPTPEASSAQAEDRGDAARLDESLASNAARSKETGGASDDHALLEPARPIGPVDPGAALFVEALASRLPDGDVQTITLAPMRNFSRASEDEFHEMRERLAGILTNAGRSFNLRFVSGSDELADFEMNGSAYLVVRSGFDFWELFPAVTKNRLTPPAWTSPVPVLFLRTDRPDQPQIFFEALGGNAP